MTGTWLLKKVSPIGNQVVGAFVTTVSLSLGFMIFNDYVAPPPDLSGRWQFTVTYENTAYSKYEDLQVTYQVLLIQEGLQLSGSGEKLSERGPTQGITTYTGRDRINIELTGSVLRNYFSPNTLVLHYKEKGADRESSTVHRLLQYGQEAMCGCFWTTIADTSGSVWWQRGGDLNQRDKLVERPEICCRVDCSATTVECR